MISKALFSIALAAYINVLCFRNVRASCTKFASILHAVSMGVSHDALERMLNTQLQWSRLLRQRYSILLAGKRGRLIIDDTVITKPFSQQLPLLGRHWSSSEKRYVTGISCVMLIWTDGDTRVPIGVRFWSKDLGKTKIDLAIELLQEAKTLWKPLVDYVLFDGWYAAAKIFKEVRRLGWHWCTRLKSNRLVNGTTRVDAFFRYRFGHAVVRLAHSITALVLKHSLERHGKPEEFFLATSDLNLSPVQVKQLYKQRQWIEETIKILKGHLSIESCASRKPQAQLAHVYLCLMAFCQLERQRLKLGLATVYQLQDKLLNLPIPQNLAWKLAA